MGDYGRTTGTGGPQTAAITNDDETSLDLPENDDPDEYALKNYAEKGYY